MFELDTGFFSCPLNLSMIPCIQNTHDLFQCWWLYKRKRINPLNYLYRWKPFLTQWMSNLRLIV